MFVREHVSFFLHMCVCEGIVHVYFGIVWQNFNFPPRRMVRTYRLPRLHTLLHCSQLFIQTTNHHDPQTYCLSFSKANDLRNMTINPGCLLSYALFSQPKWVPSLNANNFSIQCTNNASLLGISYLRRMSFSSFLSSSSVFEDVKLMSARRVTFEMNMTLAHLPVLSSDLRLTVEQKLKRKLKRNKK